MTIRGFPFEQTQVRQEPFRQGGRPHLPSSCSPFYGVTREEGVCVLGGRLCNIRIAAPINVLKCVLFSIDLFVPGIQGLLQAARIHIKHFKKYV